MDRLQAMATFVAVVDSGGFASAARKLNLSPPVVTRAVAERGRLRQPADLAQCDCLRFPLPGYRTQWTFRGAQGGTESVAVHGWLVMSTALALHHAALDGLGPALLADWLIDADIAAGRLVDLFPDHEITATNFDSAVWLLHASREHVPRRVRAFVDFMRSSLGQ